MIHNKLNTFGEFQNIRKRNQEQETLTVLSYTSQNGRLVYRKKLAPSFLFTYSFMYGVTHSTS